MMLCMAMDSPRQGGSKGLGAAMARAFAMAGADVVICSRQEDEFSS